MWSCCFQLWVRYLQHIQRWMIKKLHLKVSTSYKTIKPQHTCRLSSNTRFFLLLYKITQPYLLLIHTTDPNPFLKKKSSQDRLFNVTRALKQLCFKRVCLKLCDWTFECRISCPWLFENLSFRKLCEQMSKFSFLS